MKKGKAAGPTGIVSEMFMVDEDCSVEWLTSLCNLIVAQERQLERRWNSRAQLRPNRSVTKENLSHNHESYLLIQIMAVIVVQGSDPIEQPTEQPTEQLALPPTHSSTRQKGSFVVSESSKRETIHGTCGIL